MEAIIETGGKQYLVSEGKEIFVEKLDGDKKVTFDKVLMVNGTFGHPYVTNCKVIGEIEKQGKQRKVVNFMYKNKSRSNRARQGHRQPYTKVMIKSIEVK
jgi:large subunit ribosomal protein L21